VTGPAVVVSHRVGNDLAALAAAAAGGAEIVEADVHLHRGRLEVRHTKTLWPLPILWDRWYLADPFAPRLLLGDLLAATPRDVTLMLDLKGVKPGLGPAVERMLDADGERPLVMCSRVWRHLPRFRGRPSTVVLHSAGSPGQLRRLLARYGPGDLEGVSVRRDLLDPAVVGELRRRAPRVWTWPVDDPGTARTLASWGVTGFISDAPDALRSGAGR
jgi:glycerophosphoryl diester phosphodiesterase